MSVSDRDQDEVDLSIDPNLLDDEWLEQPRMCYRYGVKAADARKDHDEAKANMEVVQSEIAADIRSAPEKYGLNKTTEASIKETILRQRYYKEAQQDTIDARHAMEICQAAVSAIDQRKAALGKLVDLFLSSYFSTPRADTEDAKGKMDEVVERSARRKGLKRNRGGD